MTAPRIALAAANLALLLVWPIAWTAPIATAGILPYFGGNTISLWGSITALWENDPPLAVLVALFAMVLPVFKTLGLALVHFRLLGARAMPVLDVLGKLSMADVFLVALYIVLTKGVGIGYVETGWGLWLFTAAVLGQLGVGLLTRRLTR
ncbi:MAG: paraquat-inducible protein A [Pseudomonadota bacterium]